MSMYKLFFKKPVLKDIKPLPQSVVLRVQEITRKLTTNSKPKNAIKMKGVDFYSYRFSQYRIIYHVNDKKKIITIYKIGHSKDIYR